MAKKEKDTAFLEKQAFKNYEDAKKTASRAKIRMILAIIGLVFALIASYQSYLGFQGGLENIDDSHLTTGLFLAILAYLLGGGIVRAFKFTMKVAKFGWIILPFPFDIASGLISLIVAGCAFLLFPAVFVAMSVMQISRDARAAREYLSYCTPASVGPEL